MTGGAETQAETRPRSRGQHRGPSRGRRGGRGARGRGQSHTGSANPRPDAVGETPAAAQSSAQSSSPARGGRQRRGGARRGGRGSANSVPQPSAGPSTRRAFGGHLTTGPGADDDEGEAASVSVPPSLSGDAPEFVPGQTVALRRFESNDYPLVTQTSRD